MDKNESVVPSKETNETTEEKNNSENAGTKDTGSASEPYDPELVVNFLLQAGELKSTPRTGWILRNVLDSTSNKSSEDENERNKNKKRKLELPKSFASIKKFNRIESVAEHSWRVSLCSTLIRDTRINKGLVAQLGAIHDVAEAVVGDITPFCGIQDDEKYKLEKKAMLELTKVDENENDESKALKNVFSLWMDYEHKESNEAKLVKDLDKFECILQAFEYETRNPKIDLSEFFESAKGKIKHEEVQTWEKELRNMRASYLSSRKAMKDT